MGLRPGERERVVERSLSVLTGKWQPRILLALQDGALGFNELEDRLGDISGKVLTENLESLQDAGVVERNVVEESPLRVDYHLTDAGSSLDAVFDELATWGERHLQRAQPCVVLADRDRRLAELYRHWFTPDYEVRSARNADELRRQLDDAVDVAVVDRRLPGAPLSDLPAIARAGDDARRVVLLTDERPALEIAETPCDAVVRKPAAETPLRGAIETELERHGEPPAERERHALAARKAAFEAAYASQELADSDRYDAMCSQLETLADADDAGGDRAE